MKTTRNVSVSGRLLPSLVLLILSAACSTTGIVYSGVVVLPVRSAGSLNQKPVAGPDESLLGHVQARCTESDLTTSGKHTLASVACSPQLLTDELLGRAAQVGGTALVELKCEGAAAAEDVSAEWRCEGLVVRQKGAKPHSDSQVLNSKGVAVPARSTAFGIDIEVHVVSTLEDRSHQGSLTVVPRVPVSDRSLARVSASCEAGCLEGEVRAAVLTAGRRLKADHLVYPVCWQSAEATECSALASGYRTRERMGIKGGGS